MLHSLSWVIPELFGHVLNPLYLVSVRLDALLDGILRDFCRVHYQSSFRDIESMARQHVLNQLGDYFFLLLPILQEMPPFYYYYSHWTQKLVKTLSLFQVLPIIYKDYFVTGFHEFSHTKLSKHRTVEFWEQYDSHGYLLTYKKSYWSGLLLSVNTSHEPVA